MTTVGGWRRRLRERAVPSHWTFLLASVSAACLVVLTVTGIVLLFYAGPGRSENNVVGLAAITVVIRAAGLFVISVGVLFAMAGTMSVAPVWLYGPASSSDASAGSRPDWYTSFLDGALRLVPPGWEVTWLGGTWPLGVLVPQAVVGVFLLIVVTYPFLEARLTGDRREHNILDRPRDAPNRTGLGVAGLVFFGTLWAAASTDLVATRLHIAFETQVYVLRFTLTVGPFIAFWLTRRICLGLQAHDREQVDHGYETGNLRRQPDVGYLEEHAPLSPGHRWRLAAAHRDQPDTRGSSPGCEPRWRLLPLTGRAGLAPFTAVQILFVNLVLDGPPALSLGVDPPGAT